MKRKLRKTYEVFNVNTGKWEETTMTDDEYEHFSESSTKTADELEAEYEIISKIVAQKLGYAEKDESRD
tara:strand:- start:69 stop:275 length:207 start_codon:yes stop_codon:yes gene_type:complete